MTLVKNSKLWLSVLALLGTLFLGSVQASPVDTYEFSDPVTQKRYQELTKELRCPKCQNQNLADSNSPIAADLRQQVYNLLNQGKSDMEIMSYMVDRYGDFVLYRPKVKNMTYILWFGPAVLLLLGVGVIIFILRRKPQAKEKTTLSAEQQDKLKQILKD
ncbi:cytochrome c-type biogenesis protein CcmH [Thalassomonas viridans]|uniref:Cytochrome c-type biogenesis protein n=2 Tax=Thalassomonas viridans TaxID=137584 RepID=A0AAE9Z7D2_9GAMM|nr:cytochrome c-type biogenesis protein CcmH [Thalassomonas viridans]